MEHMKSAGVILFLGDEGQRKYLLLHYNDGHWDFPKGKLEPGETLESAAHRELFEEANVTAILVKNFSISYSYEFTHKKYGHIYKTVVLFLGVADQFDVTLSDEHIDYSWLHYQEALSQLTYENSRHALQEAENFLNTVRER